MSRCQFFESTMSASSAAPERLRIQPRRASARAGLRQAVVAGHQMTAASMAAAPCFADHPVVHPCGQVQHFVNRADAAGQRVLGRPCTSRSYCAPAMAGTSTTRTSARRDPALIERSVMPQSRPINISRSRSFCATPCRRVRALALHREMAAHDQRPVGARCHCGSSCWASGRRSTPGTAGTSDQVCRFGQIALLPLMRSIRAPDAAISKRDRSCAPAVRSAPASRPTSARLRPAPYTLSASRE